MTLLKHLSEGTEVLLASTAIATAFTALLLVGPGLKWLYPAHHDQMLLLFKIHPLTQKQVVNTEQLTLIQVWQLEAVVTSNSQDRP